MSSNVDMQEKVEAAARDLLRYCRDRNWAGYDPYDALNSRLFSRLPCVQNRPVRIAFTQFVKRSPTSVRKLFGIDRAQNPKGLALFISALLKAHDGLIDEKESALSGLISDLLAHRSPGQSESCWGYHFSWQTRTHLVPVGTPNIICTTFAGQALLDAYEVSGNEEYLDVACSAGRFLKTGLNIYEEGDALCFSYTPLD